MSGNGWAGSSPSGSVPVCAGHTGNNSADPSNKQQPAICSETQATKASPMFQIWAQGKSQDLQEAVLSHPSFKALAAFDYFILDHKHEINWDTKQLNQPTPGAQADVWTPWCALASGCTRTNMPADNCCCGDSRRWGIGEAQPRACSKTAPDALSQLISSLHSQFWPLHLLQN